MEPTTTNPADVFNTNAPRIPTMFERLMADLAQCATLFGDRSNTEKTDLMDQALHADEYVILLRNRQQLEHVSQK